MVSALWYRFTIQRILCSWAILDVIFCKSVYIFSNFYVNSILVFMLISMSKRYSIFDSKTCFISLDLTLRNYNHTETYLYKHNQTYHGLVAIGILRLLLTLVITYEDM